MRDADRADRCVEQPFGFLRVGDGEHHADRDGGIRRNVEMVQRELRRHGGRDGDAADGRGAGDDDNVLCAVGESALHGVGLREHDGDRQCVARHANGSDGDAFDDL